MKFSDEEIRAQIEDCVVSQSMDCTERQLCMIEQRLQAISMMMYNDRFKK